MGFGFWGLGFPEAGAGAGGAGLPEGWGSGSALLLKEPFWKIRGARWCVPRCRMCQAVFLQKPRKEENPYLELFGILEGLGLRI